MNLATEEIDADNGGAHYANKRLLSYIYFPSTTEEGKEGRSTSEVSNV